MAGPGGIPLVGQGTTTAPARPNVAATRLEQSDTQTPQSPEAVGSANQALTDIDGVRHPGGLTEINANVSNPLGAAANQFNEAMSSPQLASLKKLLDDTVAQIAGALEAQGRSPDKTKLATDLLPKMIEAAKAGQFPASSEAEHQLAAMLKNGSPELEQATQAATHYGNTYTAVRQAAPRPAEPSPQQQLDTANQRFGQALSRMTPEEKAQVRNIQAELQAAKQTNPSLDESGQFVRRVGQWAMEQGQRTNSDTLFDVGTAAVDVVKAENRMTGIRLPVPPRQPQAESTAEPVAPKPRSQPQPAANAPKTDNARANWTDAQKAQFDHLQMASLQKMKAADRSSQVMEKFMSSDTPPPVAKTGPAPAGTQPAGAQPPVNPPTAQTNAGTVGSEPPPVVPKPPPANPNPPPSTPNPPPETPPPTNVPAADAEAGTSVGAIATKAGGVLAMLGGGYQTYHGVKELRNGQTLDGTADTGQGVTAVAGGAGLIAGGTAATVAAPIALGGGAMLDGGRDVIKGIKTHDNEKVAVGSVKTVGGGLMVSAGVCAATGVGLPVAAGLAIAGGVVYGGAAIYDSRKTIGHLISSGYDSVTNWVHNW